MIQRIVFNLSGTTHRTESLEGVKYRVVPMVMLTEGVHAGSEGPLLYPAEELGKRPVVWNTKPIVLDHPDIGGRAVSACDPKIISERKVGMIMNTAFDGRLRSEAWLNEERCNALDGRVLGAVDAGGTVEVSTGVFTDNEETPGEWNGEKYDAIARNYGPDHLAILLDKTGACSVADGAGLNRNAAADTSTIRERLGNLLEVADENSAYAILNRSKAVVANQLSHDNIRSALRQQLLDRFAPGDVPSDIWIEDVYDDFFVYSDGPTLFRLGYTTTDTTVSLSDEEPTTVVRVTEYRTVDGAFVGNAVDSQLSKNRSDDMDKKKFVDGLIANGATNWTEDHREFLMGQDDDKLELFSPVENEPTPTEPEAPTNNATPTDPPPTDPPKQLTVQEYLNNAPPEVAAVLNNAMATHEAEKTRLVDVIVANGKNPFSKEFLATKPVDELRGLAALAQVDETPSDPATVPMFSGAAAPRPTANVDPQAPMEIPTLDEASA